MLVKEWLNNATKKLKPISSSADLDAEVILAHVLKVDRSWLHAHSDTLLKDTQLKKLDKYLTRRVAHEPMAYILEKSEFYGREFYITNDVLVPRPESEAMIDLYKKYAKKIIPAELIIIDVGSGSGALGVTASLEIKPSKLIAIDIDTKCNKVTKINANKYNQDIDIINGNLLEPIIGNDYAGKHIVILANLPYVPDNYNINESAGREPKVAIFGGPDGLDLYRKMFTELKGIKSKSLTVLTESLPFQHDELSRIAKVNSFELTDKDDFIMVFTGQEQLQA